MWSVVPLVAVHGRVRLDDRLGIGVLFCGPHMRNTYICIRKHVYIYMYIYTHTQACNAWNARARDNKYDRHENNNTKK